MYISCIKPGKMHLGIYKCSVYKVLKLMDPCHYLIILFVLDLQRLSKFALLGVNLERMTREK